MPRTKKRQNSRESGGRASPPRSKSRGRKQLAAAEETKDETIAIAAAAKGGTVDEAMSMPEEDDNTTTKAGGKARTTKAATARTTGAASSTRSRGASTAAARTGGGKSSQAAQAAKTKPAKTAKQAVAPAKATGAATKSSAAATARPGGKAAATTKAAGGASKRSMSAGVTSKSKRSSQADTVMYAEGSFVCFVNGSDKKDETKWDQFCIGQVRQDVAEGETRIQVHRFYQDEKVGRGPVAYARDDEADPEEVVEILDFQVLHEVPLDKLKTTVATVDGDEAGACKSLTLAKASYTKFNNSFKNSVDEIMERLGKDEGDSSSNEDEDEEDRESEGREKAGKGKKSSEPRTIAKPKARKAPAASQAVSGSQPPAQKKQPAARTKSQAGKKAAVDATEQDPPSELIETGDKAAASKKSKAQPPASQPQLGSKRSHPVSGPFDAEQDLQSQVIKRHPDDTETVIEKKNSKKGATKKAPAKPTVFKAGKWNPETVLVEEEPEKCGKSKEPEYHCCVICNMRNLHRAVDNDDAKLLRKLVLDVKNIPYVLDGWSSDNEKTILAKIIDKNSMTLLEALFPSEGWRNEKDPLGQVRLEGEKMAEFYGLKRVQPKPYLLHKIDTGKVARKAYGTAIRAVNMTRGNRQGNMAFNENKQKFGQLAPQLFFHNQASYRQAYLWQMIGNLTEDFYKNYSLAAALAVHLGIWSVALTGNRALVAALLEPQVQHENYGFNKLHLDVLKLDSLTEKYPTVSITKKSQSACHVTPLHLACINPNVEVLRALLNQSMEINCEDSQRHKPIHYAAACVESGPLELLIEKGANVFDIDHFKLSPLHLAALNRRAKNIKVILETQRNTFRLRDRGGMNAFAYALELGDLESIKAFLDAGVAKINVGQGPDRMPPLSWAATYGRYELCEWLLEQKARVLSKDKYKRTPLMMAVKNGHTRVASLLLQHGSEWNHEDSSQNSVLHYAAGFGWRECIDLLVQHGANVNATNMWKVTPITIAMLKNHQGIVKELLKRDDIDVNGKDDQGRTLLTMVLSDLSDPSVLDFVKYLVEKGADTALADVDGDTCLHHLACYNKTRQRSNSHQGARGRQVDVEKQTLLSVTSYLIQSGAPLSAQNIDRKTAFALALESDNIVILDTLMDQISLKDDPVLLHDFKLKIFDARYKGVLIKLIKKLQGEEGATEVMNTLDPDGFTPFLAYIRAFIDQRADLMARIGVELNYQEYLHRDQTDQYVINNIDLFKSQAKRDKAYQQHLATAANRAIIDPAAKRDLHLRFFHTLVAQEFVKTLATLIAHGADAHATVQKLEFYRKLDAHRKHLVHLAEQRAAGQVVEDAVTVEDAAAAPAQRAFAAQTVIDTTTAPGQRRPAAPKAVHARTRDEVLAEQMLERQAKKQRRKDRKKGQQGDEDGKAGANDPKAHLKKQLKEFYSKQGYTPRYETKGGRLVEVEYSKEYGMQGALHLIMRDPNLWIVQYFLNELKLNHDEPDYRDRTPFSMGIDFQIARMEKKLDPAVNLLMAQGARIDHPDEANQTPYLKLYNSRLDDISETLRQKGANINQMSKSGVYVLKIALLRRDDAEIRRLHSLGADMNLIDQQGRNLLHHAINQSSSTADATFETEQLLIDLGCEVNVRDCRGRVPLHYAFVKIDNFSTCSQIDPIETVSSLCAIKNLEIEVQDKWLKTPLHYAAQRSSTISSLYILQRGAQLETKDIYGNTPLGVALQRGHFNYGIILIQKSANVKVPVTTEYPNRLAKMWKDEEKAKAKELALAQKGLDVNMDESDGPDDDGSKKKHRSLFQDRSSMRNVFYGFGLDSSDEEDSESDSEDLSDDEGRAMETNLMVNQNYFNNGLHRPGLPRGGFGWNNQPRRAFAFAVPGGQQQAPDPHQLQGADANEIEAERPAWSTFRVAIHSGQQGIAYLILDSGYDYMLAMQDALDEQKFQLFLTLIQKTADDAIVQKKNDKGQSLMHILAINSASSQNQKAVITRIFNTLKARGVDCLGFDSLGCNALHYAVKCQANELVSLLLAGGISVNPVNQEGHSPLSLALRGEETPALVEAAQLHDPVWLKLLKHGADPNIVYPEESHRDARDGLKIPKLAPSGKQKGKHKRITSSAASEQSAQEEGGEGSQDYRCSIMINYVRHDTLKSENMLATFRTLLKYGARFDGVDSRGLNVLEHAIMMNSESLVSFILANKDKGLDIGHCNPANGRTAVHVCVKPLGFGSYENVNILQSLAENGFDLGAMDAERKTALDYAMEQDSKVMAREICRLMNASADMSVSLRRNSITPEADWPAFECDFTEDAAAYLSEAEQRRAAEVFEMKQELDYVQIDREFAGAKQYKVYYDSDTQHPWDAYMTKVDLRNGPYGDYVFYKMQMIFDSNRELYIVLTRYGSIGERGMHQRTPFNDVEEAKKEFRTIFKSKSGNEWEAAVNGQFVPQRKKYELTKVSYTNIKHQDYLAPFDYENCVKPSHLEKSVEDLIEEISNVTMYQRAIRSMGIDEDKLPVSALKREAILEAKAILAEISAAVTELGELRKLGMRADYDDTMRVMSKLSDLSSKYYQLVPKKVDEATIVKPIKEMHQLQAEYQVLDNLVNVEFTSRLLLAALHRQHSLMHPMEYIYKSMGITIEPMFEGDPECDLIRAYCLNTASENGESHNIKSIRIFKIERRGEQESFEQVANEIGNRKLLFHGSGVSNFLGLLAQGMRIAPPEAPPTGYMFGKGCYFADMFQKSLQYSAGIKSKLLLLCDVALGRPKKLYRAEYVEKLEAGFHSVKGCGRQGPDFHNRKVVSPQGYSLPMGAAIQYKEPSDEVQRQVNAHLQSQQRPGQKQRVFGGFGGQAAQSFYQLQHNEYIVYTTQQVRQRYIIQVQTS